MEPLAWNIEHEPILNQVQSPLFSVLPRELRDLIFEFALTDTKIDSFESLLRRNVSRFKFRPTNSTTQDIATNLLRTCRAIYCETWTLPLSLNPYVIYKLNARGDSGAKLHELLPWQLSLIQSLDITLQQTLLEAREGNNTLHTYLHRAAFWQAEDRHKGVYITPRRYKSARGPRAMTEFPASFNFSLIPVETTQDRHFLSHVLGTHAQLPDDIQPPWYSPTRVLRAKPLLHLTLRLQHDDWWTWSDIPHSTEDTQQLALDPSVGTGHAEPLHRPTMSRMLALAENRRRGNHPSPFPNQGWLHTISSLPDLKRLDLVLETFTAKTAQLDRVVEAAKSWRFPISTTAFELAWDGKVDMSGWNCNISGGSGGKGVRRRAPEWHEGAHEFVVRGIGFRKRRKVDAL